MTLKNQSNSVRSNFHSIYLSKRSPYKEVQEGERALIRVTLRNLLETSELQSNHELEIFSQRPIFDSMNDWRAFRISLKESPSGSKIINIFSHSEMKFVIGGNGKLPR